MKSSWYFHVGSSSLWTWKTCRFPDTVCGRLLKKILSNHIFEHHQMKYDVRVDDKWNLSWNSSEPFLLLLYLYTFKAKNTYFGVIGYSHSAFRSCTFMDISNPQNLRIRSFWTLFMPAILCHPTRVSGSTLFHPNHISGSTQEAGTHWHKLGDTMWSHWHRLGDTMWLWSHWHRLSYKYYRLFCCFS